MAKTTNKYELMVIFSQQSMESKKTAKDSLEALVGKIGGKIVGIDDWGEKTLAYNIEGNDKGYYVVYNLEMKPESDKEFKKKVKLEKGLMRWLLMGDQ